LKNNFFSLAVASKVNDLINYSFEDLLTLFNFIINVGNLAYE